MPALVRRLQWLGLLLAALSAFWPQHELRARPGQPAARPAVERQEVPARVLGEALRRDLDEGSAGARLWEARRWYPFLLVPVWALALLAAAVGARARARAGWALMVLALGLAVFEACYLALEYAPLLPRLLGSAEVLLAWLVIVAILLVRRAPDRRLPAVEAHVASQALLGWLHLLTLPSTQARCWWDLHTLDDLACALSVNFTPAFWVGVAGFVLASLPVYLRPVAAPPPPPPPDAGTAAPPEPPPGVPTASG